MKKETKQEKPWKKSGKKEKKFSRILIKILVVILCVLVVAAAAISYVMDKKPEQKTEHIDTESNKEMFEIDEKQSQNNKNEIRRKDGFYNILVIGRDKVALNTDVMIIASIDTVNKKAATVQIPRDSYVEYENGSGSKINAVFADGYIKARSELNRLKRETSGRSDEDVVALCGQASIDITPETFRDFLAGKKTQDALCTEYGIKNLQDMISRTFGIYFDYYAVVSTDAFVKIVDAIGGVDVYVQEPMNYDDPYQNLHIHIPAGNQHLDGKTAEGFVRFRSGYVQADIARLDAQKIFLTAFFKKLVSFSSVTKVGDILGAVYDTVKTDLTLDNAIGFIKPALSIDLSNITMLTMQGTPYRNGMYYSLDRKANLKIVNDHFNIFNHPLSEVAVNVVELVDTGSTGGDSGMTMVDISTNQPDLKFVHGSQQTTPQKPPVSDQPENQEDNMPDEEKEDGENADGENKEDQEGEDTKEDENSDDNIENGDRTQENPDDSGKNTGKTQPEDQPGVTDDGSDISDTPETPDVKDEPGKQEGEDTEQIVPDGSDQSKDADSKEDTDKIENDAASSETTADASEDTAQNDR